MPTEGHNIAVGSLEVNVVRKPIKNMHLGVYPPDGHVRVAAPLAVNDDAVRLAVIMRLPWIKRQRTKYQSQARQSERRFVSGETHYVQGRPYRLDVVEGARSWKIVVRNGGKLEFHVRSDDTSARTAAFYGWYRRELKQLAAPLVEGWASALGVEVPSWGVKRMKTKWGTCSVAAKRVWLNVELAKKLPRCLDYVVLHELTHLLEPTHSDRFVELMDRNMPTWREVRAELNSDPLAHEDWGTT